MVEDLASLSTQNEALKTEVETIPELREKLQVSCGGGAVCSMWCAIVQSCTPTTHLLALYGRMLWRDHSMVYFSSPSYAHTRVLALTHTHTAVPGKKPDAYKHTLIIAIVVHHLFFKFTIVVLEYT